MDLFFPAIARTFQPTAAKRIPFGSSTLGLTDSAALTFDDTLKQLSLLGSVTIASAAGSTWDSFTMPAATLTLTGGTNVTTASGLNAAAIAVPTITSSSATTVTRANSLYVAGAPTAGGSVTITNKSAFAVGSGSSIFGLGAWETPVTTTASIQVFAAGNANICVRNSTNHVEGAFTVTSTIAFLSAATNHDLSLGMNNTVKVTLSTSTMTLIDAYDIVLNTTTGTKIGTGTTQKLGFWNASPVAQYATTGTSTGFTAGGGTTATHLSTFTGNTGSTAYTTGDIVRCLKLAGIMAA